MRFLPILSLAATLAAATAFQNHPQFQARDVSDFHARDLEDHDLYARSWDDDDSYFDLRARDDSYEDTLDLLSARDVLDVLHPVYAREVYSALVARTGSKSSSGARKSPEDIGKGKVTTTISSGGRKGFYGPTDNKKTITLEQKSDPNPHWPLGKAYTTKW